MDLWIWLSALTAGVIILLLALLFVGIKAVSLGKRLKPFAEHLAKFNETSKQYPEAVKFYSDLAKSAESPTGKPQDPKADRT